MVNFAQQEEAIPYDLKGLYSKTTFIKITVAPRWQLKHRLPIKQSVTVAHSMTIV